MADEEIRERTDLFERIFELLREETQWELRDEFARPESEIEALRQGETTTGQVFYRHPDDGATISVRFPVARSGDAAHLLFDDPLDPQLEPSETGFVARLETAHGAIAARHATALVDPVEDPSLLARVRIPLEFEEERVLRSLEAVDSIATDSAALHRELEAVLESHTP